MMAPAHCVDTALKDLAERSPVMATLIATHGPYTPRRAAEPAPFRALCKAIIYQQLAGKAAASIHGRFEALISGPVTPDRVLELGPEVIRGAGLSRAKRDAVLALAGHGARGELDLVTLDALDDDALTGWLCRVRGVGPWTAQMFLLSELGRLDVWPTGDLGVRRGYGHAFTTPEVPTARALGPLGEPFRPYRSLVAWYCWREADATKSAS
jgi:DNA-3-methyladenine glycosylase II